MGQHAVKLRQQYVVVQASVGCVGVSGNGLLTDCKNGDKLYRHYFHTRPTATPRYIVLGVGDNSCYEL